ncbi:beta strand repeat-containing protein, partial [Helicobacter pullorum]|uniref:beta strand repeat-containing protein n=1 Tax=Helicobacter pullorum TaxID=35818 RepID=UPI001416FE41
GGGGGQKPLNNQSLENPKNAKGLDSKSKTNEALESKNPNKIQTTKIQDSKIQLESNPKDLAKLESNSPKLKDSKVSKTSKDSMKLESSPKLDSKTSQKSNSKSKSPKIQRAKNTCDSKQSKKSKNSSKLKSFIRTIPISIALASALSSQAVAAWQNQELPNAIDSNGTIASNVNMNGGRVIYLNNNQSSPDLTINGNIDSSSSSTNSDNGSIEIRNKSIAGTITNNGIFTASGDQRKVIHLYGGSTLKAFVNNNVVRQQSIRSMIYLKEGSTIQNIINNGTMIQSGGNAGWASVIYIENNGTNVVNNVVFGNGSTTSNTQSRGPRNIINIGGNRGTIENIAANGNAKLNGNFAFGAGTITNGVTFNDTSAMTGNISSSGRIGSIVLNDSSTIGGNISLTGGASIVNGISLLDSASITNGISLAGSSRISKILIDGSNSSGTNGTPKLAGNITVGSAKGNTASIDNITISNGGTYAGTIHTKNQTSIDSITIANGGVVGSVGSASTILSSGNSTIHNIGIQNGGTMYGNIEAHFITGAGNEQDSSGVSRDGNIGNVSIAGRLEGGVKVFHNAVMDSLTMSGSGTIVDGIEVGVDSSPDQTSSINTIRLEGNSGINAITLGGVATADANIGSLTLEGTSSIGTITNNSNGTITNIALNGTSTITNGITNNSGGTISNITLASSNTINNGITNNSGGNIGTIISDTGTNVNNI